jgi:hypothetical protein
MAPIDAVSSEILHQILGYVRALTSVAQYVTGFDDRASSNLPILANLVMIVVLMKNQGHHC